MGIFTKQFLVHLYSKKYHSVKLAKVGMVFKVFLSTHSWSTQNTDLSNGEHIAKPVFGMCGLIFGRQTYKNCFEDQD